MSQDEKTIIEAPPEKTVELISEPSIDFQKARGAKIEAHEESPDPRILEFRQIAAGRWDDNRLVVKSYIEDLERQRTQKSFDLLGKALRYGARYTRRLACEALAKMGEKGVEILVRALVRSDGRLQEDVADFLRQWSRRHGAMLINFLERADEFNWSMDHRRALIQFVSYLPNMRVATLLCHYLESRNRDLRQETTAALLRQGKYAEKALLRVLEKSLSAHHGKKTCIYLLGQMRSQRAIPYLLRLLQEETHSYLLSLEVWALGEMNAREAVPTFIFMLEDDETSWLVKRSVIRALGHLKSRQSVQAITPFLERRELRETAIRALGQIGGTQAREALAPFVHSPIRYLRFLAVSALGAIGDRDSLRAIVSGLADQDPLVHHKTEQVFAEIYSPQDVAEIHHLVDEQAQKKQRVAAWENLTAPPVFDEEPVEPPMLEEPEDDFDQFEEDYAAKETLPKPLPRRDNPFAKYLNREKAGGETQKKRGFLEKLREKAEAKLDEWAEQMGPPGGPGTGFGGYYDPNANPFGKRNVR